MKYFKFSILSFLLINMFGAEAFAYDACINGIYYNLSNSTLTATVTYDNKNNTYYTGSIVIPSSVTYEDKTYSVKSIDSYAFRSCSNLSSVSIPSTVNRIGLLAFSNCTSLLSISIPVGVTMINYSTFEGCTNLKSVSIPNSVTTIENSAFANCSNLSSISIPNSVTSVGDNVFANCQKLTQPLYNTTLFVHMASSYSGEYTIPDGIKAICSNAFSQCSNLSSIIIPNTVTAIGNSAFMGCGLLSINIPQSVKSIGDLAFNRCTNLSSILIPNNLTSIGEYAFDNTSWYENQSDGLVYLGNMVYRYKGTMPENTNIELDEGTIGIVSGAFKNCKNIVSISIPNNVKAIGANAFSGCTGLTSVIIPNNVSSIGKWAFYGCKNLVSITIPNTISTVGGQAFDGTEWYDNLPDGMIYIGRTAYNYKGTMPENTDIVINEHTTSIADYAFQNCNNISSVIIPRNVNYFGKYSFQNCKNLSYIQLENSNPVPIDPFILSNRSNTTLCVPYGSKERYELANHWNEFNEIIEKVEYDTNVSEMENAIYVEPSEGLVGTTLDLSIKVKNTLIPVGCSFMLTLPNELQLKKDEDNDVIYEMGDRAKKMSLTMQDWNDGSYDLALTPSSATATITGDDGVIVKFKLPIPENMTAGEYKLKLTKCLIQSKEDGTTKDFVQSDVTTTLTINDYTLGDVNNDGNVTPSDAIMTLYHYFNVSQTGFNAKAADVNQDGNITPSDAIETLYMYFGGGSQSSARQLQQESEPQ